MTTLDWNTAIADCRAQLAAIGNLPETAQDHALEAIAVLCLVAAAPIDHALQPDNTLPVLTVPQYAGRHDLAGDLLAHLAAAACPTSLFRRFSASDWLAGHGFDGLILRSVRHTADDTGRAALLAHTARCARTLMEQESRLCHWHMRALLERDTPELDAKDCQHFERDILVWLLAPEHNGKKTRAVRVQRRFQALRLYASLAKRLREPAITAVIDDGRELVPALTGRLSLTRAQLAALREATPPGSFARYSRHSFEHAVRHLQAHAVPLCQWPGRGQSGQHEAWATSPWLTTASFALIPADYYGADPTTVCDAVRGFADDLLTPLLAELGSPALTSPTAVLDALAYDNLPAAQQYLASIRRALIGDRGPKAFQEAARCWHRRAAAVAALRNENQSDRPGWPALCPPWTSPRGHYQIVPLTTAKALVEEGNAHEHCVGTYYDVCRCGTTQILSLRACGKPMVTAEILLDDRIASLRVAQFKGLHDEVPEDPALHQAMRDFLRDIRTGLHPLNRKELRAYRQWAEEHYCYGYGSRHLTIAHARQAFPLYRALLPRHAPADFDLWCNETGLKEALAEALRHVTQRARQAA
jgi:hypothetical protein